MKKGDLFIILAVALLELVLILVFIRPRNDDGMAVIELDGERLYTVKLTVADKIYEIQGKEGSVIIEVEEGRIRFLEAECPDQVCVHTGWISRPGQISACVPNGVLVYIEGIPDEGPDVVLR